MSFGSNGGRCPWGDAYRDHRHESLRHVVLIGDEIQQSEKGDPGIGEAVHLVLRVDDKHKSDPLGENERNIKI